MMIIIISINSPIINNNQEGRRYYADYHCILVADSVDGEATRKSVQTKVPEP